MSNLSGSNLSSAITTDQIHNTFGAKRAGLRIERLSVVLRRVIATEFLLIAVTAYVASAAYGVIALSSWPNAEQYIPAAISIAILVLLVSIGSHQYTAIQTQPRHKFLWQGAGAVALAFSFFLSIMFVLKYAEGYSRVTFFFQFIGVTTAVLASRAVWHARLQAAIAAGVVEARRIIIIGDLSAYGQIVDNLDKYGTRVVGSFSSHSPTVNDALHETEESAPKTTRALIEACRELRADDVLILATPAETQKCSDIAVAMSELPVAVHIIPIGLRSILASSQIAEMGRITTIQVQHPPLSVFDRTVKRTMDIVCASLGLIMLAPLILIVSIVIKLDSRGPVFFRQTRHGFNNEPIAVFKFRTMHVADSDDRFHQAKKDDPRITKVGRILRRSNIDELPQLLNVLIGEMSIVGPRPHVAAQNKTFEKLLSGFYRRHVVKPGITGWAQVNGHRGETDTLEKMKRRVECDLYYIDNWSFLFDIKIMVLTLLSKKAYNNAY